MASVGYPREIKSDGDERGSKKKMKQKKAILPSPLSIFLLFSSYSIYSTYTHTIYIRMRVRVSPLTLHLQTLCDTFESTDHHGW